VEKEWGRLNRLVLEVYSDAVTLHCPDSLAVVGELETLLVVVSYHFVKFFAGDFVPVCSATCEQVGHRTPTGFIENQSSFLWLVP
jgi:hypothetical protein